MKLLQYLSLLVAAVLIILSWWAFLDPNFALVNVNRFVFGVMSAALAGLILFAHLLPILRR